MERLWSSPVFLGLTRPVMMFGVTVEYLSFSLMIVLCSFILSDSFRYLLLYIPLYFIGLLACRIDPFIFRIINKRWQCQIVPNKNVWGCQTYDAM